MSVPYWNTSINSHVWFIIVLGFFVTHKIFNTAAFVCKEQSGIKMDVRSFEANCVKIFKELQIVKEFRFIHIF